MREQLPVSEQRPTKSGTTALFGEKTRWEELTDHSKLHTLERIVAEKFSATEKTSKSGQLYSEDQANLTTGGCFPIFVVISYKTLARSLIPV